MFNFFSKKNDMTAIFQATDDLSQKTCQIGTHIFHEQKESILNSNELTRTDAVIFGAFLNYVHISSETNNQKVLLKVIDRYLNSVGRILEEKSGCVEYKLSSSTMRKMIRNRLGFYSKIMCSKADLSDILMALCEGFECIIKTDILEEQFKPLSGLSPVLGLDFEKEACCQIAVRNFPSFVAETLEEPLRELLKVIK